MKPFRTSILAACTACLLSMNQASAVMMAGGQAATAPRQTPLAPPMASSPTIDLISGVVSSVDIPNKTMTISGNTLPWHPTQLQVFAPNGSRASERDVQPGRRVRFALEPGASAVRRVVLIYVDERS